MRDLILRAGENVYPAEIENRLLEHPQIADAAVIGVPDALLGHRVKAVIVPTNGTPPDLSEIQRWCGATLAGFKVPTDFEIRESLPYTESGKVMKHRIEADQPGL
jgi:acyl-CoA synthetase (AMP-forming)/AMP-acid ligase II